MKNIEPYHGLSSRKKTIAHHFANASNYDQHASIQQQVCELLLAKIANTYQVSVLEVGAGTGQMTRLLAGNIDSRHWIINELASKQLPILHEILPTARFIFGDAEHLDLGSNHSLIVSANDVQWFDNPLGFIKQSYERLASGGQLLLNTFTPNNFLQVKALTGQGLKYPTVNDWQSVLTTSGFERIELSTHRFDLPFSNPYAVLKHMQLTGVSTNHTRDAKNATPFRWTKSRLQQFEREYWQQFGAQNDKGELCVNLTYEVLMINAVKP